MQDIKITVKVEGLEPLISAIMYLGGAIQDQTGTAPKATTEKVEVKKQETKKQEPKQEVKKEEPKQEPEDEKMPWDDQEESSSDLTIEDVRVKLVEISKQSKENRAAVKALIQEYGAERLSDLKPEHFAEVLEKAEAL